MSTQASSPCRFLRRLAAMFYDGLLLIAIWFVATALILPINGGNAVTSESFFYKSYLIFIAYWYFCWQWYKGQQTLGMRAWGLHLYHRDNHRLSWKEVTVRFFLSLISLLLLGMGFIYSLFRSDHLTWHDLHSHTKLIHIKAES